MEEEENNESYEDFEENHSPEPVKKQELKPVKQPVKQVEPKTSRDEYKPKESNQTSKDLISIENFDTNETKI